MKHFYIIANLDKEYVQEAQVFIKAYLEAKGAECLLHHTPERTRGAAHIDGAQVPEDTECVITIGGDGTLIQAARDLAGRNIHGTAWRKEETLLKDIALNEIAITRKDPLKVLRYSVYVNDEYLNEYAADGVLVATPTGSTAYNLSAGGPVIAPGARMMVLTPICSHSLNARSIVLAPEDRVRIKVLNSGQVVSFDGDTSMELKAGDCIDIRCSELQTVMIKVKQISFMQNLSNHLGGI